MISTANNRGPKPRKSLGQNFLADPKAVKKMVDAADISKADTVLEIGPGTGVLTMALAEKAGQVIAVEKDPRMIEILKETFKEIKNVEIIHGDIIQLMAENPKSEIRNPKQITNSKFKIPKHYKVVANLPFYIASPVIRQFLEAENPPQEMTLIVQKEVAQRICAKPPRLDEPQARQAKMNLLAVSVQVYAQAKIISYISKGAFSPRPNVDAAIIKITPYFPISRPPLSPLSPLSTSRKLFFQIVKAGFSHPRKQLLNNLSSGLGITREKTAEWLIKNNIDPKQRAETLSITDWLGLAKSLPK